MAILFCDDSYRTDKIFALLQANLPNVDLRKYPETGNPGEIDYAIILRPKPGSLCDLPNLKLIFTIGAGVDGIIHDTTLPDVPIIRNTDPHLQQGIRDYLVHHVLRYHRNFDRYQAQQHKSEWTQYRQYPDHDTSIGFMGLGMMSHGAAICLQQMGFKLRSWSRTPKSVEGIISFHGPQQLNEFLNDTSLLINVLPLTDATRGILNAALFAQLPAGARLINIGRGAHLVEKDLLTALESGHLQAATLDVFATEPLPADSPLWSHPKITITPHIASLTDYTNLAQNILKTIHDHTHGLPLKNIVDRHRQY